MQAESDTDNSSSFNALETRTNSTEQVLQCWQFATVSDSLRHDSAAVWAHMQPIFKMLTATYPNVDTIHFQSDGPVTQYKNRANFYLMVHFAKELNLKSVTWNFTEPGHGKSAADGVGGQLKSKADMLVSYGNDITDANSFLASLKKTNVNVSLFKIDASEIEMVDKIIPGKLSIVPSIMKLKQITWNNLSANHLYLRTLSCITCDSGSSCKHFSPHQSVSKFCFDVCTTEQNEAKTVSLSTNEPNPFGTKCTKDITEGDWVGVCYDNQWYAGTVEKRERGNIVVSYMHRSGNKFFWPSDVDRQTLPVKEIMCIIDNPPHPISSRFYEISDVKKFDKIFEDLF